jgi:hypothetical protein
MRGDKAGGAAGSAKPSSVLRSSGQRSTCEFPTRAFQKSRADTCAEWAQSSGKLLIIPRPLVGLQLDRSPAPPSSCSSATRSAFPPLCGSLPVLPLLDGGLFLLLLVAQTSLLVGVFAFEVCCDFFFGDEHVKSDPPPVPPLCRSTHTLPSRRVNFLQLGSFLLLMCCDTLMQTVARSAPRLGTSQRMRCVKSQSIFKPNDADVMLSIVHGPRACLGLALVALSMVATGT